MNFSIQKWIRSYQVIRELFLLDDLDEDLEANSLKVFFRLIDG